MKHPNRSKNEKIRLEHQAAKLFMRRYERLSGKKIRHIWHNDPREPDVSCMLEDEQLDLEIAHLYGSEVEAMKLLGRELSERTQQELKELEKESDSHIRLLNALNRILLNKSTKRYKTKRVWLVIRNAHPDWEAEFIPGLLDNSRIPQEHPFEQIWLIADFTGKNGIFRLYPPD